MEQSRLLRDHCDLSSERSQLNLGSVVATNVNGSILDLNHATKCKTKCGLAGTCSTNHTNLFTCLDFEVQTLEYNVSVRSVPELNVLELDGSLFGPRLVNGFALVELLLRSLK